MLAGLADHLGVHSKSLWAWLSRESFSPSQDAAKRSIPIPSRGTCRFGLEMESKPRRDGMPPEPFWRGDAIILGNNALAREIQTQFSRWGRTAHLIDSSQGVLEVEKQIEAIWSAGPTPHLFLVTPHDELATDCFSATRWRDQRERALMVPFRLCQLWLQRMIDQGLMREASLVSVLNAGGDFGFSASRIAACESGGLAGLTKAMLIESWMRGFRETPMKVIDVAPETPASKAVEGIFRELAVPSHDEEVAVAGDQRWSVKPSYRPFDLTASGAMSRYKISRGGTWVVTGGARGITALTAMALAEKYGLVLHLLGTAPNPTIDASIRELAITDRGSLRRDVMRRAQESGQNPIELWRDMEKAIEIDQSLAAFRQRGIQVKYHSVDVAEADQVNAVLQQIRLESGPIRGVIHGAGAGQDARFDRKRLDKVEKCIRAKVDGAFALAEATLQDPLAWFVGFGSISGRFGANGHTDYSLANDMLAKVIGRLRQQRPDVACVTFHWHAWGDVGMATKPEAKLALEMIGMQFMPAEEGLAHFLNELEFGGDMSEVLITDRNYIRKFFPGFGETLATTPLPMLDPAGSKSRLARTSLSAADAKGDRSWVVTLDPTTDPFLRDHLVGGMPTLPFVIALEMLAEAALDASGGQGVSVCKNARAHHPVKFSSDDAMAVEIVPASNQEESTWRLQADLRRRDGRVVKADLLRFEATFEHQASAKMPSRLKARFEVSGSSFSPIQYMDRDGAIYHGEAFQSLRSISIEGGQAVGQVAAPSPVQVGGVDRPVYGWVLPCSVLDSMLYASAVLAFHVTGRASLPVHFAEIHMGRLPDVGEPLSVIVQIAEQDEQGMLLHADLIGLNDDHLLAIRGYRIHWLQ